MRNALFIVFGMICFPSEYVFADVFDMQQGIKSLAFVEIGDPGNKPDSNGLGAVPYRFKLSVYEVTTAQWVEFLNAKAKADRDGGLWNNDMDKNLSGDGPRCEIKRTGEMGSFKHAVSAEYANRPVTHVSFLDACRFCNWLHNGQGDGDTETGAYELKGYYGTDGRRVRRNSGAKYFVPTEDEWYKSAYYDPRKSGGPGYWKFPTRSDEKPGRDSVSVNAANWFSDSYFDPMHYFSEVGEFANAKSPYGTFDQAGNVFEWTEGLNPPFLRTLRGGAFDSQDAGIHLPVANPVYSSISDVHNVGIRIAASLPGESVVAVEASQVNLATVKMDFPRRPWLDPQNGKPFFPLAWFSYASDEKDLDAMAKQGVNLVLYVNAPVDVDSDEQTTENISRMRQYLDMAEKRNIRVLIQVGGYYSAHIRGDKAEIARQQRFIESISSHPAIFGYQLYDEPEYRAGFSLGVIGQQQLREVVKGLNDTRDALRRWDKNQQRMISVVFNLVPLSSWTEYLPVIDSFQIDRYPLDKDQAFFGHRGDWGPLIMAWSMFHGAQSLTEHPHLRNPAPCMQGVGSNHTEVGTLGVWRNPLYEETRFMAYSSLTVGAWGVFHWIRAFGRPDSPTIDENVGRLYHELRSLIPAFEMSYQRPPFHVEHNHEKITRTFLTDSIDDITTLALEDESNYYLIVSNNSGTFSDVTLKLRGLKLPTKNARQVKVLNESWERNLAYSEDDDSWQIDPHSMTFGDINVWIISKSE